MDTPEQITPEQITPEQFQAQCQEFVERLAGTLAGGYTLGVAVNSSLHFAGLLMAQYINLESTRRPTDFQSEMSIATGVLTNATAHSLHNVQSNQVSTAFAANDSTTKH